jgi:CRISPR/Cas system CSM-associated protein Csm3 (group 7 of RAMP superfamily)
MATEIRVKLELCSDFHIGTGTGVGRTVDAVVARDTDGMPLIPGSTLKGLTRWHAEQVLALHPSLDDPAAPVLVELFGEGGRPGTVLFENATPASGRVAMPVVNGRSARDRGTGRALDEHLFQVEDAAAGSFACTVRSHEQLSDAAMLVLIVALRRIEAIGGQRRRGKGRARTTVEVLDGPRSSVGLKVPGQGDEHLAALLEHALGLRADPPDPLPERPAPDRRGRSPVSSARERSETGEALLLLVRARGPLTLATFPETRNTIPSLAHIPGTSLRGAIAHHLLRHGWSTDDDRSQHPPDTTTRPTRG